MSDKSLWLKNNKLIAEGGILTGCDNCPCPYYAVFAIATQSWYPGSDGTWSYNCYQWIYTAPFAVRDNKINYQGVCINIDRNSPDRLVGSKKGCSDSYQACAEYDPETWECTKTETAYVNCGDYKVYRLSGCFDNYEAFAENFYDKCGVEPDENGNYPNIFDTWEGEQYPSGPGMSCAMGEWSKIADRLLVPKFDLVQKSYRPSVQVWANTDECTEYEEYTYTYCVEPGEGDSCARYETFTDRFCVNSRPSQQLHYNGEYSYFPIMAAYWGEENPHPCCEYYSNYLANIPAINQKIADIVSGRNYPVVESVTTFPREWGQLCWGTAYESYACHEFFWTGDPGYWHKQWGYEVWEFRKNSNTPDDAVGVKILLYKKHITYSYEKDAEGRCQRTEEATEETQEVTINFDEPYELPEVGMMPNLADSGFDPCTSRYNDPNANPCDFGGYQGDRPNLGFTGDCSGVFERYEFSVAVLQLKFK